MTPRASSGGRIALIIGNDAYRRAGPLPNCRSDCEALGAVLRELGFADVRQEWNLAAADFPEVLADFGEAADTAELAMLYFAGHGMEIDGETYLLPVDAEVGNLRRFKHTAQNVEKVISAVEGARKLSLVVLDACRDNPFRTGAQGSGSTRSVSLGLGQVEPHGNVLIAYAAKHGTVARDGEVGGHSPFANALLENLRTPSLEIRLLFGKVRDAVLGATGGEQEPHLYGSLGGDEIYLNQNAKAAPDLPPPILSQGMIADVVKAQSASRSGSVDGVGTIGTSAPQPVRQRVLISTVSLDRADIAPLETLLRRQGWVVEDNYRRADCVLAVWSKRSINARAVLADADRAKTAGKLLSVSFDGTEPAARNRADVHVDLSDWRGSEEDGRVGRLLGAMQLIAKQDAVLPASEDVGPVAGSPTAHTPAKSRIPSLPWRAGASKRGATKPEAAALTGPVASQLSAQQKTPEDKAASKPVRRRRSLMLRLAGSLMTFLFTSIVVLGAVVYVQPDVIGTLPGPIERMLRGLLGTPSPPTERANPFVVQQKPQAKAPQAQSPPPFVQANPGSPTKSPATPKVQQQDGSDPSPGSPKTAVRGWADGGGRPPPFAVEPAPAPRPMIAMPAPPPPTAPVPAPTPRTFRHTFASYSLDGGDLANVANTPEAECEQLCRGNASCVAYVVDRWNRWCHLKSSVTQLRFHPKYTTRLLTGTPPPNRSQSTPSMQRLRDRAFTGSRAESTSIQANFESCENACERSGSSCEAFGFDKSSRVCSFYVRPGEYFDKGGTDSGYKEQDPRQARR